MKTNKELQDNLQEVLLRVIMPDWQSYERLHHFVNVEMRKFTGNKYFDVKFMYLNNALLTFDKFYPLEWKKGRIGSRTVYYVRLKGSVK